MFRETLFQLGRMPEAIAQLKQALRLRPTSPPCAHLAQIRTAKP
jgi:hypothetical protein